MKIDKINKSFKSRYCFQGLVTATAIILDLDKMAFFQYETKKS